MAKKNEYRDLRIFNFEENVFAENFGGRGKRKEVDKEKEVFFFFHKAILEETE